MARKIVEWDGPEQYEDPPDHVEECLGCPDCGETRVDYLEMLEDDLVHCLSCQRTYDLTAEPDIDSRRENYYQAGRLPPQMI